MSLTTEAECNQAWLGDIAQNESLKDASCGSRIEIRIVHILHLHEIGT